MKSLYDPSEWPCKEEPVGYPPPNQAEPELCMDEWEEARRLEPDTDRRAIRFKWANWHRPHPPHRLNQSCGWTNGRK